MPFFSFKVWSNSEVDLPEHLVTIGEGQDVFCARVEDLDSFTEQLRRYGIRVIQVTQLDDLEAITPVPEVQFLLGNNPTLEAGHGEQGLLGSETDDVYGSEN
jgi:hypothetical protein